MTKKEPKEKRILHRYVLDGLINKAIEITGQNECSPTAAFQIGCHDPVPLPVHLSVEEILMQYTLYGIAEMITDVLFYPEKHGLTDKQVSLSRELLEMHCVPYLVFMKTEYVRDTQIFNASPYFHTNSSISNEEFESVDVTDPAQEKYWQDSSPIVFAGCFMAKSAADACQIAALKNNYDERTLYAQRK